MGGVKNKGATRNLPHFVFVWVTCMDIGKVGESEPNT